MSMFYRHNRGGKRLQRKPKSESSSGARLAALLLCLSMLMGFLPALASAADDGEKLSSIVTFDSIHLFDAGKGIVVSRGVAVEIHLLAQLVTHCVATNTAPNLTTQRPITLF